MRAIQFFAFLLLMVNSKSAEAQIDSNLIQQLFIKHYRYITYTSQDSWQIHAVSFNGGSFLTRKGAVLIDSTVVFKGNYSIKTYAIRKGRVHIVSLRDYFQKDSIGLCVKAYEYHRNGFIRKGWEDCKYSLREYSAYKNEYTKGRRNGQFTWTFTDSNGRVRVKSKFDDKVDYPKEFSFYDCNGAKEFTLLLLSDTQDKKWITTDTIFADSSHVLGYHSFFIYRYICNHINDHAFLRTQNKLYYLRRNKFHN